MSIEFRNAIEKSLYNVYYVVANEYPLVPVHTNQVFTRNVTTILALNG